MKKKLMNALRKMPPILSVGIAILLRGIESAFSTENDLLIAKVSQRFDIDMLIRISVLIGISLAVGYFAAFVAKAAKMSVICKAYTDYQCLAYDSKMSDIQATSTGKIYSAVSSIAALNGGISVNIINISSILIPLATLLYKEIKVSVISAMVTIVCIFASAAVIVLADRLGKFSTESAKHKSKLSAISVDNFMNLKTLKFLGKCGYALGRHEDQLEETYPWYVNSGQMLSHKIGTAVACIPMIVNMYINRHDLEMVTFIAITNGVILNSAGILIDMVECLIERKASLSVIKNLKGDDIEEYPDVPDKYEINDVEFDYGKDSTHFHINNLLFEKNKRYHVVGESGEGKSSLANLISGSINSTKGSIEPIKTFYVYQETECLDDTLRNNISFGDPNIPDSEIMELIEDLNMGDWFKDLKDGLDTILGERGFKLSSGQKQRINIIRSILRMRENKNEMIILDEITSNLDSDTEKIVVDMIDKECNGTCMIISHHGDFSKICDEQILVKNHKFSQTKLIR